MIVMSNIKEINFEDSVFDYLKDKIDLMGTLDKDMKQIYNKILKSKFYSTKVKRDIHTSFNNAGVYGLPKP